MQSAILFFIASSVGVTVGWQPMPDGSPRYEYVVQLDRELLATLKQGESIPISSEVPDDVRPIARVRIVVGDETLPRQKLVTQFKPWPKGQSREGVVETQYVVPKGAPNIAPRYENQPILPADSSPQPILPPTSRPSSDNESFGRALQRSAEQARSASAQGQILPPTKEVTKEILPPQNAPRYAEPIRTANQQDAKSWRNSSPSSQADIQQLFGPAPGEKRRGNLQPVDERSIVTGNRYSPAPSDRGPITPGTQPILPPTSSPATNRAPTNTVEIRNANEPSTGGLRYRQREEPIAADDSANRSQLLPSKTPVASPTAELSAPWPAPKRFEDAPLAQEWNTRNGTDGRMASRPADNSSTTEWPKPDAKMDSFDIANQKTQRGSQDSSGSMVLSSPSDSQRPQSPPPTPEIRRDMLSQPADAQLRTASGDLVKPTPASLPAPPAQPTAPLPQSTVISQPQIPAATDNSPAVPVFPLVLAWVLLSGSGAGNLYLFWSYLDIRNKYRGIIRTAGRKLGRHTDEDDYDD